MNENKAINEKLLKPYNAAEVESNIYTKWELSGLFNPDECVKQGVTKSDAQPFTIIMPPPNSNGSLHAGHALFVTLQDIMTRFARMQGKKALWLPGADHAGFETQVVYEKKLEKEGRSRFDMKPDELHKEIMDFTLSNKTFMEGQLRQLGASCDWSRELFTLDDRVIKTVYDTFKQLSTDGLLYRGNRIVNWCPKHQTSLSNLETERITRTDPFYYFQYGPFVIGTARPETKFGDKYVVMHPNDARYKDFTHGQQFELEWINGPITATVIKDEAIDMSFGTGVMTITPWHDATDFEIATRHNLETEQVIDWRGKLLPIAREFEGMSIKDARPKIVEKLKEKGLLVKIEDKAHEVPVCYKCEREIEPQVRPQWFVSMRPLADKAIEAVKERRVHVLTENHERILLHWLENIQDWNISRQIVWGIPIPAWFKDEETHIGEEAPGEGWTRDPDTFDTWFSSGQWPYVTLGFPDSKDFKTFYPTEIMESGADLVFFWIARMIMLGLYRTGDVPFKKVYLHGLVRDAKGQKMSKSKGNVISPLEISEKYGTDALRMGLVVGNTPGTDLNLDPNKIGAYKKFANKIWNASRFVLENTQDLDLTQNPEFDEEDQKSIDELNAFITEITKEMEDCKFYIVSEKLYHYFWHTFADVLIERSKNKISEGSVSAKWLLHTHLIILIKALHPFMPFITEELWSLIPKQNESDILMVSSWPGAKTQ